MKITTLYVTHKNQQEADKVVNFLLEKRLIACANFFPITSTYWWKDKLETQEEIVSLLKTKEENFEIVRDEILKIHPYETPCILKMDMEANDAYGEWITGETKTI